MEHTKDDRLRQLNSIHNYAMNIKTNVTFLLQSLGWNSEYIVKDANKKLQCPFDKLHFVSKRNLDDHIAKCRSGKNYCQGELYLPENCNKDSDSTCVIDSLLVSSIIDNARKMDTSFHASNRAIFFEPSEIVTTSQMICNFTRDERRAIYDYLRTKAAPTSFQLDSMTSHMQESSSNKTHLEDLAQSRDMKRRRMKYKVATKSKKYTDVLREMIETQMSFLTPVSSISSHQKQHAGFKDYEEQNSQRDIKNDSQHVKRSHDKYEDDKRKNKFCRETSQNVYFDNSHGKFKKMRATETNIFKRKRYNKEYHDG